MGSFAAEEFRLMICPRAASLPIAASKTAKWGSDQSAEVFVPASDFSSNQMHKHSVMGRCSFAVSLASDGPIPLDSQPGSVLREKHLASYLRCGLSSFFVP